MKFSLRFNNDLPAADCVRYAQAAEAAGFQQFWVSNDLFLRSAPVILSAIATATERIEIGSCILNPYTIHPAEIAMFAATLDELAKGRFNLGLAAGAAEFIAWLGLDYDRPRSLTIETIAAVNRLTSGQRAASDGQILRWSKQAYLRFKPRRRVPIYLGAMSPKMLEDIGAIADGGLPLLLPPEHYQTIKPYIQRGLKRAGRRPDEVDVAACIWCSVSEDHSAAEAALADKIAYYGYAMSPLILERLGLKQADFAPLWQACHIERNPQKARALVTAPMLKIGIAGTTDILIQRLEGLAQLGVRHMSLGPPLGPDILAAIQAIGRDVIPHFSKA